MCMHLNETVGFIEAHSDEWGSPHPSGGGCPGGHPLGIFEKIWTYLGYFQDKIYSN